MTFGVSIPPRIVGRRFDSYRVNPNMELDLILVNRLQITAASMPAARSYQSMTANKSSVFVFGGCGAEGRLNDLHSYDPRAGRWQQHTSDGEVPSIRGGPALFATDDKVYVFGTALAVAFASAK
jgi:N-acetylneuraminic acid mutarotase